jgi:hypothetical protein
MAERYRDLAAPSLIDVSARSTPTGGDDAAARLSDTFASFSRTAAGVGATIMADTGERQGIKDGAAGTPKRRSPVTAYGRSYNSAAEAAYSAKVQIDIDDTISRLEDEHEADPETFEAKVKAYSDSLTAEAPEHMRDRVGLISRARSVQGSNRVRAQAISRNRAQAHADYLGSMGSRVNNTMAMVDTLPPEEGDTALQEAVVDNRMQLDALVREGMDPVLAERYHADFQEALDKGLQNMRINGVVEELNELARIDVRSGDAAFSAALESKGLSAEDKDAITKEYRERRSALEFERSRELAPQSGELARSLALGGFGGELEAQNEELYSRGAVNVDEYESNRAAMARNEKEGVKKGIDIEAVQAAMQGGPGLDPTIKDHRDAVNEYLKQSVAVNGMKVGDDRYQMHVAEIARKTNILPESADSWGRVGMLSGDPQQVAQAAGFFTRIKEANPRAWNYADDPRLGAMVDQVDTFMRAGVVTERAFELAHKNVYETTENTQRMLADRYRQEIKDDDNSAALQSMLEDDPSFDPEWFSDPVAPLEMQAEYDQLVRQFYDYNNGDLAAARKMAGDSVRAMYGRSTVNGTPEILKYAPEKMFGLPPEVVREDLERSLREAVGMTYPPSQTTVLEPEQEAAYRNWMQDIGHTYDAGFAVSPDFTGENYDYRGYFKKYGPVKIGEDEHLYDEFKLPTHPTFSDESIYATGEAAKFAGRWEGETYIPSPNRKIGGIDPSTVRLTMSPATERSKGVWWHLTAPDEYGVPDVILGKDNRPVEYALPIGQAFEDARSSIKQRKLAEAQALRDKYNAERNDPAYPPRQLSTFR